MTHYKFIHLLITRGILNVFLHLLETKDTRLKALMEEIISQCCNAYVNCFHVFYPTSSLKWECLANFMHLHLEKGRKYTRMLSCVICSVCCCRGQLLGIFPVLNTIVKHSPDETSVSLDVSMLIM